VFGPRQRVQVHHRPRAPTPPHYIW
jgi:hypothetical protein